MANYNFGGFCFNGGDTVQVSITDETTQTTLNQVNVQASPDGNSNTWFPGAITGNVGAYSFQVNNQSQTDRADFLAIDLQQPWIIAQSACRHHRGVAFAERCRSGRPRCGYARQETCALESPIWWRAWRRSSKVSDSSIKKELGTLRTALYLAQEQGFFKGNPALAIPASFKPESKPAERSPTREEFIALVQQMHADAAAATAFILATSAEWSALTRAKRADLPTKLKPPFTVHVRGSKTDTRDRTVPIVTDEQVTLLAFVAKHAGGKDGRLFSGLANFNRTLAAACEAAELESASANDFRHAAGQWLIDVGTPIELVSRFMGHADTRITERVYARVKQEHVGARMLDALDAGYTRAARKQRQAPRVRVITTIPDPKLPTLYEVAGVSRSLSEWAQYSGISKNTWLLSVDGG